MSVRYVDIHRFVWMLISSEITRDYRKSPVAKLSQSRDFFFDLVLVSDCCRFLRLGVGFRLLSLSSTWCWFQIAVSIKQETSDDFFDLATVSGVFGKYAKKSKLVVWLV